MFNFGIWKYFIAGWIAVRESCELLMIELGFESIV